MVQDFFPSQYVFSVDRAANRALIKFWAPFWWQPETFLIVGVPDTKGFILGVPLVRSITCWGLHGGPPMRENSINRCPLEWVVKSIQGYIGFRVNPEAAHSL